MHKCHNARCFFHQLLITLLFYAGAVNTSSAGLIVNDPDVDTGFTINFFEPIGQSFVAEDSHILASLYYDQVNPGVSTDITLGLYEGPGSGGALLASDTFSLAAGFEGFYDSDFSAASLTIGGIYSIAASIPVGGFYWGVDSGVDDYSGGGGFYTNPFTGVEYPTSLLAVNDLAFRITPVITDVPEPATLALFGFGFIWLGRHYLLRRRFT